MGQATTGLQALHFSFASTAFKDGSVQKSKYWYGTSTEDLQAEMLRFSKLNGYPATAFARAGCECDSHRFKLESDEEAGAARRICAQCGQVLLMGDSDEFADEAEFDNHACVCDGDEFETLSGIALYEGTADARWHYIGCRCLKCSLVGVFAH